MSLNPAPLMRLQKTCKEYIMKKTFFSILFFTAFLSTTEALADARVMNPGLAYGQLVVLSSEDVTEGTPKFKSLYALSIPVFAELPMELAVVAGAITLKQQNLLSHVQIKSMARKTPNLDISDLDGGLQNALFQGLTDGDWVRMELGTDGSISLSASTEKEANDYARSKTTEKIDLKADMNETTIFQTADIGWQDFVSVGSKAANYAELAKALNTTDKMVVREGFAIPFFYYQQFVDDNPMIAQAIQKALRDPLMKKLNAVSYRETKLGLIQELFKSETTVVNPVLVDELLQKFETVRDENSIPMKMKLRSSTNAEDLPNFNGAGLYSSKSYKPLKKKKERTEENKKQQIAEAIKEVWASVWNLRAFEERMHFGIPHKDVKMGIQINPSFPNEDVDGVIVTLNAANDPRATGDGVYIEAQRGDEYSVANPIPGIQPDRIFVKVDPANPLDKNSYNIVILQHSNIANDNETILQDPNPEPTMTGEEIKELAYQCLKAEAHFRPILGNNDPNFALDLEFKVMKDFNEERQVYLKQARPYIH